MEEISTNVPLESHPRRLSRRLRSKTNLNRPDTSRSKKMQAKKKSGRGRQKKSGPGKRKQKGPAGRKKIQRTTAKTEKRTSAQAKAKGNNVRRSNPRSKAQKRTKRSKRPNSSLKGKVVNARDGSYRQRKLIQRTKDGKFEVVKVKCSALMKKATNSGPAASVSEKRPTPAFVDQAMKSCDEASKEYSETATQHSEYVVSDEDAQQTNLPKVSRMTYATGASVTSLDGVHSGAFEIR